MTIMKLGINKRMFCNVVVLITLLFGSESWTPHRSHINQLDVFHNRLSWEIYGNTIEGWISNVVLFRQV